MRQRTQGGVGWEGRWRPSPFEAADCPCKSPRLPKLLESWCNHRDHLGTRAQPPFIVLEPQSNPRNDLGDLGVHFGDATKGWKGAQGQGGRFLAATQLGLGTKSNPSLWAVSWLFREAEWEAVVTPGAENSCMFSYLGSAEMGRRRDSNKDVFSFLDITQDRKRVSLRPVWLPAVEKSLGFKCLHIASILPKTRVY